MAELPKVEMLSAAIVLRDLRVALVVANKELEAAKSVETKIETMLRQCSFYERGMDAFRTRIVRLLMAHLRHAEAACADDYILKLDEALIELKEKNKKAESAEMKAQIK